MCQRLSYWAHRTAIRTGIVQVDKLRCIGCDYCVAACPFHVRYLNPQTGVADKCNFCADTWLAEGQFPACVSVCRNGAEQVQSTATTGIFDDYVRAGAAVNHHRFARRLRELARDTGAAYGDCYHRPAVYLRASLSVYFGRHSGASLL